MNIFDFFRNLSINPQLAIVGFGFYIISILIAITVHEFFHALAAYRLGDQTANFHNRLNLNPLNHLDPLGTLFIILGGFGWGKPTPYNPWNLKNPRRDSAVISFAGPLSNFLMAALGALLYHLTPDNLILKDAFFRTFVILNISLGLFNLVPVSPLDGFKVVSGLLPKRFYYQWEQTAQYGFLILMFLILLGRDLLSIIIGLPAALLLHVLGIR